MENSSLLSVETMYIIQFCHWTFLYIPFLILHLMVIFILIRFWKQNYDSAFYVYVLYLEFIDVLQLLLLMFNSLRYLLNDFLPFQTHHTLNHVQFVIWVTISINVSNPHCAMMITRYLAVAKPMMIQVILKIISVINT